MVIIMIIIIPRAKSRGILLSSNSYTHTHTHTGPGCVHAETKAAEARPKYFILYLIGFLGTVYNLTAVIHTGPATAERVSGFSRKI